MAHLYKVQEWTDCTKKWHVGDVSDLAHDSNLWYIPPRMLGIPLDKWIEMLITDFNATIDGWFPDCNYGKSLLCYHWDNYNDAHKYVLWVNKQARHGNWTI